MLQIVRRTIALHRMLAQGEPVWVALSGGADSTALLRALLALGYPVRAFHLNHHLRGAESDRDEAFCRALCEELGVPLRVQHADITGEAEKHGESIETAARRARYDRLAAIAQGEKIATAHTADDNIETMLFHFARGTGPKGLSGIPPVRDNIIRPLLYVERAQVEAYLEMLGQSYVTDSTNHSDQYTRNRIRHMLVPVLRDINTELAGAAARLGGLLRQDDDCLTEQAHALVNRVLMDEGTFDTRPLCAAHPALRSRALRQLAALAGMPMRDLSAQHIAALEQWLDSADPSAVCSLPHGFCARREYALGRIVRCETPAVREAIPLTVPFCGMLWDGKTKLTIRHVEKNEGFYNSFNTFCVDCGTILFETLCVRPRQSGDRIRLTSSGGSRTLKRLMIDRRIPRLRRDALAVIADDNGVIAVQDIGMDISRIPQGKALLEIKIEE